MNRFLSTLVVIALAVFLSQPNAIAGHLTHFGAIDELDALLPEGGGTASGTLSSGTDDDWVGFYATAGDSLSVTFFSVNGHYMDGIVFREGTNGVLDVGDAANITECNVDRTGDGDDLVVQHDLFGSTPGSTNYSFGSVYDDSPGGGKLLTFTALATGYHVAGISAGNEGTVGGGFGPWAIEISGNTGNPDDDDGDGVANDDDDCPDSNLSTTVAVDDCDSGVVNPVFSGGCTLADLVDVIVLGCVESAKNHGKFVSCFSHGTNSLKAIGLITSAEKGLLQSCAAESDLP